MKNPDDHKYRQMIINDLEHSMLVEAGAGSGKTTSLVERMLALIANGKCTVDKMAAVTFTRKAAAELSGRFQMALEKTAGDEKDKQRRSNCKHALSNLELLFSGTIHSFCARLLRERPIEAGIDPDFKELEEDENFILIEKCWPEYLEGLYMEDAPILEKITAIDLNPAALINTYKAILEHPEVDVVRKELERPDFIREKRALRDYLNQAIKTLPEIIPKKGWDDLQSALRDANLRCRYLDLDKDVDFIKVLTGFDKDAGITQNRWPDRDVAKEQKEKFNEFRANVVVPCLERWRSYCHFFIMELVVPAVDYFKSVREKDSLLNFNDLLHKAAGLLRNNLEVRQYFQGRFTHILVDEFQDTDPIQAEVILYLTGEDLNEMSWRKQRVRPGSLFIVGDPKQSIFRFRRADIDTYNEVKNIIKDTGGRIIPLTTNFRSVPPVCDWINPIFRAKFPAEATRYQPAFEELNPFEKLKAGGIKRINISDVPGNKQTDVAIKDAAQIASWISWALKEKEGFEGPGDFMILLRYKKHLSIYARALEVQGIPFEITGGAGFKESEELKHLLNLLHAVSEPEDQVALVAALRGPFFGVSDDLLYRFHERGGYFNYLTAQDQCKDKEAKNRIGTIFEEFLQFYRLTRTMPPAASLSLILDRLGIIPLALTKEMGKSRAGNLLRAIELFMRESSGPQTSFTDLVKRLEQYYKDLELEAMSVEPGKKDAVRVMNLHKAKGLEAKVVFLADPLKEVLRDPERHISRKGDAAIGYFMAEEQKSEFNRIIIGLPPDWEQYQAIEQEYQRAEEERLLYVGATRAMNLLVVSTYPKKTDKGAWKELYPYLNDVEELEHPESKAETIVEAEVSLKEFEAGKKEVAENITSSKMHTYKTEAVTALAEASSEETPFSEDTGRGMSWGRVIHRMLQATAKDETTDLDLMAENLLKEEERPLLEKEAVVAATKAVMASKLWDRMKKAETAMFEVPFSLKKEDSEFPTIVSGAIDLAFKEPDGWVIADYKTDKMDGNLDALIAYYRPQIEMYRKFWEEMSGKNVKEAGLYFVDGEEMGTLF